jgi:hypothetical protein
VGMRSYFPSHSYTAYIGCRAEPK